MGRLTDSCVHDMLNHTLNGVNYTPSGTNLWLLGCTASPGDGATGASCNEHPATGGYARMPINFWTPLVGPTGAPGTSRTVYQTAKIDCPEATGNWTDITHWAVADSGTHGAGTIKGQGEYDQAYTVTTGTYMSVDAGVIWLKMNNGDGTMGISTYWANQLLSRWFGLSSSFAIMPASVHLKLMKSQVSESWANLNNQQISGLGYTGLLINPSSGSSPKWAAAASRGVTHSDVFTFASPTGTWTTAVAVAVADPSPAYYGKIFCFDNTNLVDFTAVSGDVVRFSAGTFSFTIN